MVGRVWASNTFAFAQFRYHGHLNHFTLSLSTWLALFLQPEGKVLGIVAGRAGLPKSDNPSLEDQQFGILTCHHSSVNASLEFTQKKNVNPSNNISTLSLGLL
jgi:hypothetical protein